MDLQYLCIQWTFPWLLPLGNLPPPLPWYPLSFPTVPLLDSIYLKEHALCPSKGTDDPLERAADLENPLSSSSFCETDSPKGQEREHHMRSMTHWVIIPLCEGSENGRMEGKIEAPLTGGGGHEKSYLHMHLYSFCDSYFLSLPSSIPSLYIRTRPYMRPSPPLHPSSSFREHA